MLLGNHSIFTWLIHTPKWLFYTCPLLRPLKHFSFILTLSLTICFVSLTKQRQYKKISISSQLRLCLLTHMLFCYSRWPVQCPFKNHASMFALDYILCLFCLFKDFTLNFSMCFLYHQCFPLVGHYL